MNAGHSEGTHQPPTGSVAGKLRRSNWRPPRRRGLLLNVTAAALVCRCLQGFVLTVLGASVSAQAPAPVSTATPAGLATPADAPAAATPAPALPTPAEQ